MISKITAESLRKAVEQLAGKDIRPKCSNHHPELIYDDGTVQEIECSNCHFHAFGRLFPPETEDL